MEEKRNQKPFKLILKILGSGAALYFAIIAVDWQQLSLTAFPPNWYWLPVAFIAYFGSQWLSAFRLQQLFKADGIHISVKENAKLYWIGMLYNFLIPGGIGGDGYKVILLKKYVERKSVYLAKLLMVDRSFGLLGLLSAGAIILSLMPIDILVQIGAWLSLSIAVVFGVVLVSKFAETAKPVFWKIYGLSVVIQWMQIISIWMLLWSFLGMQSATLAYGLVFLASSLASVFPLSIGGIGIRELAFVYGARYGQLDENIALQLSLGFLLMTISLSLVGFPISLQKKKWDISAEPLTKGKG